MELRIEQGAVKMKTLRALERGSVESFYQAVRQFAYDDDGQPMDPDAAEAELDEMTADEVHVLFTELQNAVVNAAIPPQNARNSHAGSTGKGRRRSG